MMKLGQVSRASVVTQFSISYCVTTKYSNNAHYSKLYSKVSNLEACLREVITN